MTIEFRCPTGHRLSCADDMAGRTAKCPKCSAIVRIPEAGSSLQSTSDSGISHPQQVSESSGDLGESESPAAADSSPGNGSAIPAAVSAGTQSIVFLCPNGHKLASPASLQGARGKCPHCGAKFIIPLLEDQVAPADEDDAAPADAAPTADEATDHGLHFDLAELGMAESDNGYAPDVEHPMARFFAQVRRQRSDETIVELHLKGGQVLAPHWYSPQLSQLSYGTFAEQDEDESVTLSVVAWDTIERVSVRGLMSLPEGMFE